jgi:hypothetical protein
VSLAEGDERSSELGLMLLGSTTCGGRKKVPGVVDDGAAKGWWMRCRDKEFRDNDNSGCSWCG